MTGLVTFEAVWKKFRKGERHDSLRDLIPSITKRWIRRSLSGELGTQEFWAVKDVSFVVKPGQALGIVGANGAGKSTILKLLNRILRPTKGICRVQGRVGALIEIAAGFHPDLTGRENVYLQGAIMGMKRHEIARKFDQIVEFSGVSDFIDTQVKRYSSGMNARLGFAIAAHLDPEVLLIDEVLSVGDFSFQRKAFRRMREIVSREIPIVVVSHQLEQIASLCSHALLLSHGVVVQQGSPGDVIMKYMQMNASSEAAAAASCCPVEIAAISVPREGFIRSGERAQIRIAGRVDGPVETESVGIAIRIFASQTGQLVFSTSTSRCGLRLPTTGDFELEYDLQMNVQPGVYLTECSVWDCKSEKDLSSRQSAYLHVSEGLIFSGVVQMNPRITFVDSHVSSVHER
ncbi:MAG: polysaccharide ABC transporter ATP-binding protein [Acidobacteriota bacterium]